MKYSAIQKQTKHCLAASFSRSTRASQDHPGFYEAREDKVLEWQQHQLDHAQTICTSLQTGNHTNTSSHSFYRPDALPDAQPTVPK